MLSRLIFDQHLLFAVVLIVFVLLFRVFLHQSARVKDSREPVSIRPTIPIIGHVIGLFLHGSDYYEKLRAKYLLPIYALEVFGHNIYVVNSPELVSAVDRNAQDISFAPYVVQFAARGVNASEDAVQKLSENIECVDGIPSLRIQTRRAMRETMAAGSSALSTVSRNFLRQLSTLVGSPTPITNMPVPLFRWARDTITMTSTNAVYGHGNPFLRQDVADGLWDFEKDIGQIALNWHPELIASKGHHGRETIVKAFIDYFRAGRHEEGSPLVKGRYHANATFDVSLEDHARLETSLTVALLVNTAPATFWTLFHVLSDCQLLQDLRQQLKPSLKFAPTDSQAKEDQSDQGAIYIDMAQVLKECPLLKSTMEEILRIRSANAAGRMVMRDTMLNNQYLLRAKSTVLIPAVPIHNDATIWGDTVRQFDAYRFVKHDSSLGLRQPAYTYRAFGGGAALCPGRFLASMEILSLLTLVILRYDITPVDSKGNKLSWQEPRSESHILTSILAPAKDITVSFTERREFCNRSWHLTVGDEELF